MSRTITVPPIPGFGRSPIRINVFDFMLDAAIVEGRGDKSKMTTNVTYYEAAGLMRWDGKTAESIELTPRGTDLGASAGYIPEDPEPVVEAPPEPEVCSECRGSGKVVLFAYGSKCSRCEGSGEEPSSRLAFGIDLHNEAAIVAFRSALTRVAPVINSMFQGYTTLGLSENEHGTLIDSEETAREFVRVWVVLDAPEVSPHRQHCNHGERVYVAAVSAKLLILANNRVVHWCARGNVRLRIVD